MTASPAEKAPTDRLITLPPGKPKLTLGYEVALWGMDNLIQPNGQRAGQPWEPVASQLRFLLWWYAVDENGNWLFHHGVRRLSKGSGKSPFAGVLGLAELCGPVRLKDFDPSIPGGCIGMPVNMPWVQVVATAESQTTNTMRMVRAMAPKGSDVVRKYGLDPGKMKYFKAPEGTLEIRSSSSNAAEGAEASFVIGDETEHWKPGNGGPELAATLADNLAKSGSRMLETCNSWVPGAKSVAENTYLGWLAQEEGRTRGESKILYDARIAPPETNIADEASLMSALEFVYDDCYWADLHAIKGRIWDPRSRPDDSKRKYLNWPTAAQDSWTTQQAWAVLADPTRLVADGEQIVLFFDGSKSRDATALIGCCLSDGYVFALDVWEPDTAHTTEDVVPTAEVDAAVHRAFERYDVLAFFADVQEWEGFVKVTWPQEFGDQVMVWATPSGKDPQAFAWDMRTHVQEFTLAAELAQSEILDAAFRHDGDSRVARHVTNARMRPNRWGTSIGKESPSSPHKVDAAVCVIGARHARRLVLSSKAYQRYQHRAAGRGRVIVFAD